MIIDFETSNRYRTNSNNEKWIRIFTNFTKVTQRHMNGLVSANTSYADTLYFPKEIGSHFVQFEFLEYMYFDKVNFSVTTSSNTYADTTYLQGYKADLGEWVQITQKHESFTGSVFDVREKTTPFNKIRLVLENETVKNRAGISRAYFTTSIIGKSCLYFSETSKKTYDLVDGDFKEIKLNDLKYESIPNGIDGLGYLKNSEIIKKAKEKNITNIVDVEIRNSSNTVIEKQNIKRKSLIKYIRKSENNIFLRSRYTLNSTEDLYRAYFGIANENIYYLFSNNQKDYYGFKNGKWKKVDPYDRYDVLENGTNFLKNITSGDFKRLSPSLNLYYGVVFIQKNLGRQDFTSSNAVSYITTDFPKVNSTQQASMVESKVKNTLPVATIIENKNSYELKIQDANTDYMMYRIYLNNNLYFPSTSYEKQYLEGHKIFRIYSDEIKIGKLNEIKVEYKDGWGEVQEETLKFFGEYKGLMFIDPEDNSFYSNEFGKVIKKLQAGVVLTGKTSEIFEIKLRNTNNFEVVNPKLQYLIPKDKNGKPKLKGVGIEFSKKETPFQEKAYELSWENGIMRTGDTISFYIRVFAEQDAGSVKDGEIDIVVNAIDKDHYKGDKSKLKYIV